MARQVRSEWDRIAATKAALTVRLETKITGVEQDGAKLVLVIGGDAKESFDIVVLAVGFGLEEGGPNHVGYWNDADGLDGIADGAKVLISGFGDGGLADVLRPRACRVSGRRIWWNWCGTFRTLFVRHYWTRRMRCRKIRRRCTRSIGIWSRWTTS